MLSTSWPSFIQIAPVGGYSGTIQNTTGYCHPFPGQPAYVNASSGCASATFDLSAYAGQRVWLAWNLGADSSGTAEGWYIDNVQLTATVPTSCTPVPQPVGAFTVRSGDGANFLEWVNPTNGPYAGTVIRARTDTFPVSPTDGVAVTTHSGGPGSYGSFTHAGLTNGTTYYYAAFVDDGGGGYSAARRATVEVTREVALGGTCVRVPNVRLERCRACGWEAPSGRDVGVAELLLAPQYSSVGEVVDALKAAGYRELFLTEDVIAEVLTFGPRVYVASLTGDLRDLYLDSESSHVLAQLATAGQGGVPLDLGQRRCTVRLPKVGEGENGVVFDYEEADNSVLKLAKPRPYSREHIREECEVTAFFSGQGIPVPAILDHDPWGSFCIKKRLAGQSLAVLYDQLGPAEAPLHRRVRREVERFTLRLIELFENYPEAKTSLSPNNIFVVVDGEECRCLLVDTGPAPSHDYSRFDFTEYWERVVPEKIARYRQVGYI